MASAVMVYVVVMILIVSGGMVVVLAQQIKMHGDWRLHTVKTKMPVHTAASGEQPEQQRSIDKCFMAVALVHSQNPVVGLCPRGLQLNYLYP